MLAHAHTGAPARLAAAVLALALSGAPGLASLLAPEPVHRCTCRATGRVHECACPRCHAAAQRASERRSPPCHPAAPSRPAPAPDREPGVSCWTGTCGSPEGAAPGAWALDAFTVPGEARLPVPPLSGQVASRAGEARELLLGPEPPPPRAA